MHPGGFGFFGGILINFLKLDSALADDGKVQVIVGQKALYFGIEGAGRSNHCLPVSRKKSQKKEEGKKK